MEQGGDMNDKDLDIPEVEGGLYVAVEYKFHDCGFIGGAVCAFATESFDFCKRLNCLPSNRSDGLNVIFMEVQ